MSFKQFVFDELRDLIIKKNREIEDLKIQVRCLQKQVDNMRGCTTYYVDPSLKRAYDLLDNVN